MLSGVKERLESASSLLTHRQCPRKYYYRYVRGLEQAPSAHLVVGNVVHSVISFFHGIDLSVIPVETFFGSLRSRAMERFEQRWAASEEELEKLHLTEGEVRSFYLDARSMVGNFLDHHISRVVACQYRHGISAPDAFRRLRPWSEVKIRSDRLGVTGVLDAVHDFDGETVIIDYKTSKKDVIDGDYMLQLAVYAVLYREYFGRPPDMVGIHFLRYGERLIPVTPALLALAEQNRDEIRGLVSGVDEADYPRRPSGLCKYSTGQCDYYEICSPRRGHYQMIH